MEREFDGIVAEKVMGWIWTRFVGDHKGNIVRRPYPGDSSQARMSKRADMTETLGQGWYVDLPHYSSSDADALLIDTQIQELGLIEAYQDALIDILSLDMRCFNSAIELGMDEERVEGNYFEWAAHGALWKLSHPTPYQKCLAALKAVESKELVKGGN